MVETTVTDLVINNLSKEAYEGSSKSPTELWFVADDDVFIEESTTKPILTVLMWTNNTQIVSVDGVTANNLIYVYPDSQSELEYKRAGVVCTAQTDGKLTFTCKYKPISDLTVCVRFL